MNIPSRTSQDSNQRMITMCSICHSVKLDGQWLSYNDAELRIDVAQFVSEMHVSHGFCTSCLSEYYGYETKGDISDLA